MKTGAMRKRTMLAGAFGLLLALGLIIGLAAPALAVPGIPHRFAGFVTIDGAPSPEGITVSARIGGVEYGSGVTDAQGRYGYPPTPFYVAADDPDTPGVKEGGVNGDTIEFWVKVGEDWFLGGTDTFQNSAFNQSMDLAVSTTGPTPTPTPTPAIPNAPSNLMATAISSGRIDLSWQDNSPNETGFKIERKAGAEGSYRQIATVGADITTCSDVGLIDSTTYYYRVRTYNDAGHSSYSNEDNATTLQPEYHIMGGSAVGLKQSVSVMSLTKTDRYCDSEQCLAPTGAAFVVVSVSVSNLGNAPLTVRRIDFSLRDSATRDPYGLFDYSWGDVGDPFPQTTELLTGETVAGVILYLVPEAAPISGMEVVYVLGDQIHIWRGGYPPTPTPTAPPYVPPYVPPTTPTPTPTATAAAASPTPTPMPASGDDGQAFPWYTIGAGIGGLVVIGASSGYLWRRRKEALLMRHYKQKLKQWEEEGYDVSEFKNRWFG